MEAPTLPELAPAPAELPIKLCVVGAPGAGKTWLCRTLAETSGPSEYAATAGVRVQTLSRRVNHVDVKVQLWDVAGSPQFQHLWPLLSQDVDGVVLVLDAAQPEQERQLAQLYVCFAQPHSLTMKQCCVLAVSSAAEGEARRWTGLRGKLSKLQSGMVDLGGSAPEQGRQAALELLDRLLAGCVAQKKDKLEQAVLAGSA